MVASGHAVGADGIRMGGAVTEDDAAVLRRRAASRWTLLHPIFALGQLLVFFVSVGLLVVYLRHGVPFAVVHVSVLTKIALMVGAVVTGALWEHDVYGYWWFAPAFMIEDTMTVIVFILQISYLVMHALHPENMAAVLTMLVFAYAVYVANVAQYIHRTQRAKQQMAHHPELRQAA